ncbi:DUF533 domain-containing protein [Albirhodobacter sp. R86504]|uniref:DUF533 domain-containing protein n=1 Tax=Albirhodobacter sp. R86504 TaxID=3093848 RepID=UPI003671AA1F
MSLMKTLAKVALGVAVAKGMKSMSGSGGRTGRAETSSVSGLDGMMESLLGQRTSGATGLTGGLGGLLAQFTSGQTSRRTSNDRPTSSGFGGLLGALGGAGGLGALLAGSSGFGSKLNSALASQGEPAQAPTASDEALAGLMILAMTQAAKSDGEIDAREQETILQHLGDVSTEEATFVQAALEAPLDVEALAAQIPPGLEAQVYTMSVMAIDLDNQQEAQYLHSLAQMLELREEDVNKIHSELGAPALYA